MIRLPFKYIFLAIFVVLNLFGINKLIPTIQLLKLYVILGLIPLVLIFIARFSLINLLILFFFFALFKELGQLPLPLMPDISPWRLVWIILFLVLAYELVSGRRRKILPFTDIEIAMVLFSGIVILSMISSGTYHQEGKGLTLNYFLNGYGFPFSIFFLARNIVENEDEIKKIFIFFAMIGLYLGLTGIFEHFHINKLVYPSDIMSPWKGVSWGRARGPFMNSAVNGTAIGMIIFMLIYLLLHEKLVWRKIFFFITLLCMLTTLLFTLTRGCWIAFLVAMVVASIFISKVRKVFVPGLLGLIAIIVFMVATSDISFRSTYTERELQADTEASLKEKLFYRVQKVETVVGRLDLYKISFKMFLKKPFFGYGYGAFVEAKRKFVSESSESFSKDKFITHVTRSHDTLVGILVDLGLVGFSFLIYIVFRIFSICKKLYIGRYRIESKFIAKDLPVLFACVFIVYLINIQTIDIRVFLFTNSLFFLLAGIIVGMDQRIALRKSIGVDSENEHATNG